MIRRELLVFNANNSPLTSTLPSCIKRGSDGLTATTHHMYAAKMQKQYPAVHFVSGTRFVENGKVATAGGLTSGIDLSLHIVERYCGREVAQSTADFLEYGGELWKSPEFSQVKPVVAAK